MKSNLFTITALTNMHVGSGDVNFGVIDNLVQRDVVTNLPIINSSSLKGAIREFFESKEGECSQIVKFIFGASAKHKGQENSESEKGSSAGNYKFLSANLLSIPIRSDKMPFFRATSPSIILEFLNMIEILNIDIDSKLKDDLKNLSKLDGEALVFDEKLKNESDIYLEDFKAKYREFDISKIKELLGDNLALLSNENMKKHCKKLPVVARNYLENGQSKNLWYEEIMPRESKFYFFVSKPSNIYKGENNDIKNIESFDNKFENIIKENIFQIGANGSIGYGFSKIENFSKAEQ